VRILEGCLSTLQLDAVKFQIFQDAPPFHLDDRAFVVHKIVDGKVFLQRVIDAAKPALLQPGKVQRRLTQSLLGTVPVLMQLPPTTGARSMIATRLPK